jgi:uncharacterized protein
MVKITDEMKDVAKKSKSYALATVNEEGIPNVVPIGCAKFVSDDEILLVKVFEGKTWDNLKKNSKVAVSVWDMEKMMGYQFKGDAQIETSGRYYDEGDKMIKAFSPNAKAKAAVIVKVSSVFITSPGRDAGKEMK